MAVAVIINIDANPATSHMFIVSPLSGDGILPLFSTHPPIGERIKRLEGMVSDEIDNMIREAI